jgi:hypothetical protein
VGLGRLAIFVDTDPPTRNGIKVSADGLVFPLLTLELFIFLDVILVFDFAGFTGQLV